MPAEVAAGLVLKFVTLGNCQMPLNRLQLASPTAVGEFENLVPSIANRAQPVPPAALLNHFFGELRTRLEPFTEPEAVEFMEVMAAAIADYERAPYDPFDELVDEVAGATAALYAPSGLTAARLRQEMPAQLVWCHEPPSTFSFASAVTATVELEAGRMGVKVAVCPPRFDAECVLALPYILLHEYVCHGARLVLGGPRPTSLSSPYTEGWMDVVALRVHDRLAACLGRGPRRKLEAGACNDCARRLHDVRHAVRDRYDHIGTGRAYGRKVAQQVEHEYPDTKRRPGPLPGVSARLNGSALTDDELDRFVLAVGDVLRTEGGAARLSPLLRDASLAPDELVHAVQML